MNASCHSTGQWLLLEAPQIVTRRQQVPFRSFLRCCTFSYWMLSHCWCCNDLTQLAHNPQVEACRLYSKFSARPSNLEAIPSVVEKVAASLFWSFNIFTYAKQQNGKWELIVFLVLRLFAAVYMDVLGPAILTLQATWWTLKWTEAKSGWEILFSSACLLVCVASYKSVLVLQGSVLLSTSTLECSWLRSHHWCFLRLDSSQKTTHHHWQRWQNRPRNTKVHVKFLDSPNLCFQGINNWHFLTGAAYAQAESGLREFIEMSGLPFLPTPMGKGVLPDDHPNCVAAARSRFVPSKNYYRTLEFNVYSLNNKKRKKVVYTSTLFLHLFLTGLFFRLMLFYWLELDSTGFYILVCLLDLTPM